VAQTHGLELRHVPIRCTVKSDGHLLVRVVRNFLSNAIRYTKRGRVLLGCRREGDHVRIEVHDSGAGMPPDKLEEIFEEFRRLVGAAEDYERGFGLGLAIVRRIARMLDHPLSVRSTEGRGSCFAVTVPVVRWEAPTATRRRGGDEVTGNTLAGKVVVVVENEPAILDAMATVLERWDCRVVTGTSGARAEAALAEAGLEADVVVADYHLDENATGLDTIENIRADLGRRIPGIVVTADRTADVRKRIDAAGCSVLNKPVRPGRLRSLLSHILIDGGDDG
jgi:CheY-like chemotaxis protein/anti-sigma regulatory factor (Ser/Thr protein kinase)